MAYPGFSSGRGGGLSGLWRRMRWWLIQTAGRAAQKDDSPSTTDLAPVGAHRNADVQAAIRAVVALYVALYNERVTSHPRDPLKSNHLHTLFWDSLRSRNTKQVHIGNTR